MIKVLDKEFDVFIPSSEIASEIKTLAGQLNQDYNGKEVVFIAVLNGAFMFASDLFKQIELQAEISFVKVSSYVGTSTSGRVDELIGLNTSIQGKDVVILEDIVDTGITIDKVVTLLKSDAPTSIKICTLLFKPDAFVGKTPPDYVGFSIPNKFVLGYGLDYNEKGRNLNSIYQVVE